MIRRNIISARNKISNQLSQIIQMPCSKLSPAVRVIENLANDLLNVIVSQMETPTQCIRNTTVANFATVEKKGGFR